MAFELKIQEQFISGDGKSLGVIDISDWTQETRANYGVFVYADYIDNVAETTPLDVTAEDPVTDASWAVVLDKDGRVVVNACAVLTGVSTTVPGEGTVRYLTDTEVLSIVEGGSWREATKEEVMANAAYLSNEVNLPILISAHNYRSKLNLEYITRVKYDLANGYKQDELYYTRGDLDYITSLISGAELNFGLELYTIFYDIVENLNKIVKTKKLS